MILLKSSPHIRTNRSIKSYKSCISSTGFIMNYVDVQRIDHEDINQTSRVMRRYWLIRKWRQHLERIHLNKSQY